MKNEKDRYTTFVQISKKYRMGTHMFDSVPDILI